MGCSLLVLACSNPICFPLCSSRTSTLCLFLPFSFASSLFYSLRHCIFVVCLFSLATARAGAAAYDSVSSHFMRPRAVSRNNKQNIKAARLRTLSVCNRYVSVLGVCVCVWCVSHSSVTFSFIFIQYIYIYVFVCLYVCVRMYVFYAVCAMLCMLCQRVAIICAV